MTVPEDTKPTKQPMASHDKLLAITAIVVGTMVTAFGIGDYWARTQNADVRACQGLDAPAEVVSECLQGLDR